LISAVSPLHPSFLPFLPPAFFLFFSLTHNSDTRHGEANVFWLMTSVD
jgi:hypothetical protein